MNDFALLPNLLGNSDWEETKLLICTVILGPRKKWLVFPSVHSCVRPVRKKSLWLSPFCSTYWCYIDQTCTKCSSWLDLLMSHGGLCPWPTFHAWVTMVRKKWLCLYYGTYWCYIHQNLHQLLILTWSTDAMWWLDRVVDLYFTLGWPSLVRNMVKSILQ